MPVINETSGIKGVALYDSHTDTPVRMANVDGTIRIPVSSVSVGQDPTGTYINSSMDGLGFSTSALLANGATYDSTILSLVGYTQVQTDILSDVDGTIVIDFIRDAAGTDILRTLTIPYSSVDGYQFFSAPAFTPYVRYRFTANEAGQADFYFDTKFLTKSLSGQILGADAFISPSMTTSLTRSILVGKTSATNTYQNLTVEEIAGNRSLFDELIITERTPLIELNPALGLSVLRDVTSVANTGTITNTGGEFVAATGGTTASTAQIQTVESGRYYPGTAANAGLGVRVPDTYTGTSNAEWGYFGATDGFGFGVDSTNDYIFYTRASSKTKVYQSSWNVDVMDGTGPSGATLDISQGNIYQITFSWYGYGVIEWYIVMDGFNGKQVPILVHRYRPTTVNSIQNPNQPITVKVDNGNTTTNYTVYVGGRQFSIYGRYIPSIRRTQESHILQSSIGTTFVPLVTFRRKSGFNSFPVKFHEVNLISDASLLWEVRVSGSLTNASFGAVTNVPTTETALEVDVSATAITGGQKIESGLVNSSGVGAASNGGFANDSFSIEIPGTEEITLCARTLTGTATVTSLLGMEEEW
jgi:hypothetical protein